MDIMGEHAIADFTLPMKGKFIQTTIIFSVIVISHESNVEYAYQWKKETDSLDNNGTVFDVDGLKMFRGQR